MVAEILPSIEIIAAQPVQALIKLGYPPEWQQFPMTHAICREEIPLIRNWLVRILGNADAT